MRGWRIVRLAALPAAGSAAGRGGLVPRRTAHAASVPPPGPGERAQGTPSMLHLVSSPAEPAPVAPSCDGPASADPLLGFAGAVAGLDALVLDAQGPELLCGLIRRGCLAAALLRGALAAASPDGSATAGPRGAGRVEACAHDLVIAAQVSAATSPEQLVRLARRTLVPSGRIVARVSEGPGSARLAQHLVRLLRLNGFIDVRTRLLARPGAGRVGAGRIVAGQPGHELLVRADLPAFALGARSWQAATALGADQAPRPLAALRA